MPTFGPWQRFPGVCRMGLFHGLVLILDMGKTEDFVSMFGNWVVGSGVLTLALA